MKFDTEAHIEKMQPSVTKLVTYFKNKGVEFTPSDKNYGFGNVTFSSKDKVVKMSNHSFYRYTGIAYMYKDNNDNSVETIEVTDEMYLNIFIKPIIELFLK
jgi:hypothetical protein